MIRVFLADDHVLIRMGMSELLHREGDMKVAGEGRDAFEVLDRLRHQSEGIDVLVMDYSMPGKNGFDLLRELRVVAPRVPILILSMQPEERFALRALRSGAAGYITKNTSPEEILGAIRKVAAGGRYISATLAERLALEADRRADNLPHLFLSDREFQVMCMIASGKRTKEIADELHLSFKTINTFRMRILKKMNMKSNVELTHYALQNGLID